jgi:hypothetical protein
VTGHRISGCSGLLPAWRDLPLGIEVVQDPVLPRDGSRAEPGSGRQPQTGPFCGPVYGFRKLVDIAERSIADPFDDPTTAVQAIDRLHDCLRELSGRRLTSGEWRDSAGVVRVRARQITWEGYVRLAFTELTLAGTGSPQVARRLFAALDDLIATAPETRRPPLERQRELLEEAVGGAYDDPREVAAAQIPDIQGIGSGADVAAAPGAVEDAAR